MNSIFFLLFGVLTKYKMAAEWMDMPYKDLIQKYHLQITIYGQLYVYFYSSFCTTNHKLAY